MAGTCEINLGGINMPKVSIVLPSYNGERYIREAIQSVCEQTYRDWELIIVDDCSIDNTLKIAEYFSEKDGRIRVIHNDNNKRLPASLNIGFSQANGSYLTWTSDDNIYHKNAIEKMVDYLDEHTVVPLVRSQMEIIDENNKIIEKKIDFDCESFLFYNNIGACFMYRKSVLECIGGYDENLFCVEDYDYWMRIYEKYNCIGGISDVLYSYRMHANTLTSSKKELVNRKLNEFRKKHFNFIVCSLRMNGDLLTRLYYEMNKVQPMTGDEKKIILKYAPWLRRQQYKKKEDSYVIYGAGAKGRKMAAELKGGFYCFVDMDKAKQGTKLMDKDVLPIDKAIELYPNAVYIIAADLQLVYGMIKVLESYHIYKYIYEK